MIRILSESYKYGVNVYYKAYSRSAEFAKKSYKQPQIQQIQYA
jgi:hypothetical protein